MCCKHDINERQNAWCRLAIAASFQGLIYVPPTAKTGPRAAHAVVSDVSLLSVSAGSWTCCPDSWAPDMFPPPFHRRTPSGLDTPGWPGLCTMTCSCAVHIGHSCALICLVGICQLAPWLRQLFAVACNEAVRQEQQRQQWQPPLEQARRALRVEQTLTTPLQAQVQR